MRTDGSPHVVGMVDSSPAELSYKKHMLTRLQLSGFNAISGTART